MQHSTEAKSTTSRFRQIWFQTLTLVSTSHVTLGKLISPSLKFSIYKTEDNNIYLYRADVRTK